METEQDWVIATKPDWDLAGASCLVVLTMIVCFTTYAYLVGV